VVATTSRWASTCNAWQIELEKRALGRAPRHKARCTAATSLPA
jgi:hypothetical protein